MKSLLQQGRWNNQRRAVIEERGKNQNNNITVYKIQKIFG